MCCQHTTIAISSHSRRKLKTSTNPRKLWRIHVFDLHESFPGRFPHPKSRGWKQVLGVMSLSTRCYKNDNWVCGLYHRQPHLSFVCRKTHNQPQLLFVLDTRDATLQVARVQGECWILGHSFSSCFFAVVNLSFPVSSLCTCWRCILTLLVFSFTSGTCFKQQLL